MPFAESALLGVSILGIILTSRASDWHPFGLWVLLLAIALLSDFLAIHVLRIEEAPVARQRCR